MASMFDYLNWRGDLSFKQDPPNEVDALIFSTLAYIQFGDVLENALPDPMPLRVAASAFFALEEPETRVRVKKDLELLKAAAEAPRFANVELLRYQDRLIPEQETQFAALTFRLDDDTLFVTFRGTDNTLVGWKEDFNMSFQQTVPAQRLAHQYVREVAMEYDGDMRIGGHSKGGNLAVFAAARSSPMIQERILEVYNNDGPGFTKYMMGDPGYLAMVPRIRTHIPQSSVIGMLLEHEEEYNVIRSNSVGILQHDPYSWELMAKDFILVPEVTEDSKFMDATIKAWFSDMTNEERNQLVDVMFGLLGSGGVESTMDILHPKSLKNYLVKLATDEKLRHVLSTELQGFIDAAKKTWSVFEQEEQNQKALEAGQTPE